MDSFVASQKENAEVEVEAMRNNSAQMTATLLASIQHLVFNFNKAIVLVPVCRHNCAVITGSREESGHYPEERRASSRCSQVTRTH